MTCPICDDDGWVDIPDEETGGVLGPMECPRLHDPGHAAFNASDLLPAAFDDAGHPDAPALSKNERDMTVPDGAQSAAPPMREETR